MSITKGELVDDLEPFAEGIRIMVRDAQGNVVAVKGTNYELHPSRAELVLVLETQHAKRGRRT